MKTDQKSLATKNEENSNAYPKFMFDGLFVLFKMGGLYKAEENDSIIKRMLFYTTNVIIVTMLFVLFTPAEVAMITYTRRDLNLFVEHIGMTTTHLMGFVKYCFLLYNYGKLKYIISTLDAPEFKYEDYEDYQPGKLMQKCRKWSNYICVLFFWLATLVPLMKQYDSLVKFVNEGDLIDTGNSTCQEMLPYFNWFPFDMESKFRCEIAFLLQSIPMIWYCYPIISGDCCFGCFCLVFRSHFINLQGAFRTIKQRCLVRLNLPPNYEPLRMSDHPRLEKEIRNEVRRVTIHLQTMIRACDIFEEIYTIVTLLQTLTSMFLIVTCLYIISNEEFMSPIFIAELQFVGSGSIELLLYCAFGNEMTDASAALLNAIYESEWFSFTEAEKRTLIINMMRMQRPIKFTTGKFAVLSFSTFVSIVKGSYSYFTFLRQSK